MKIVFLGTPNFARIVLEKLTKSHHKVVAVVCSVDKEQGRGKKLTMPEAKVFAQKNNIPVFQFSKIRFEGVETLKNLGADIFVTAAFGQILSQEILNIAPYGVINVHGSLLPKYRGASPVQTALLMGEKVTGVTIMKTFVGIDDGDILSKKEVEILDDDNSETLMEKLAVIGGELLVETLDKIENGTAEYKPQDHTQATFTKMLKKENSFLNFSLSAESLHNFVRAYNPNPSAHFVFGGDVFKVLKTAVYNLPAPAGKEGEVVISSSKQGLVVACKDGFLEIVILQAQNGKVMSAKSYLNGKAIPIGTLLN